MPRRVPTRALPTTPHRARATPYDRCVALVSASPDPHFVMSPDGLQLATYEFTPDRVDVAPVVLVVHGFASSASANWQATGWVRELGRAGFRVIGLDQRGHGASAKPHDPAMYSMQLLVDDLAAVIDTYLLDELAFVGYSLGGRVGWHAALELPHRITRAVLGGIPDGLPLTRFRLDEARAFVTSGTPVEDRLTDAYLTMAGSLRGNDLAALIDLVEGMRDDAPLDPAAAPDQPILFATGNDDSILERSRALSDAAPGGVFYEIPGRNHFNAPTSRHFRDRALAFLAESGRA